jgi:hypothetical protein
VHAVVGLAGVTGHEVPGYAPEKGRSSHRAFGLRVAIRPRDTWWAIEVGVGGERLAAPTLHVRELVEGVKREEREVSGLRLGMDLGIRARAGTRWMATAYGGLGLQAHLSKVQDTTIIDRVRMPLPSAEDLTYNAVLTLGLGTLRRIRGVMLGIDFQMRQGVPAEYRSVVVLLSAGFPLDQGD